MLLIPNSLWGDGPEPGLAVRNERELCERKQSAGQPLIYGGQPAICRTYATSHKVHIVGALNARVLTLRRLG